MARIKHCNCSFFPTTFPDPIRSITVACDQQAKQTITGVGGSRHVCLMKGGDLGGATHHLGDHLHHLRVHHLLQHLRVVEHRVAGGQPRPWACDGVLQERVLSAPGTMASMVKCHRFKPYRKVARQRPCTVLFIQVDACRAVKIFFYNPLCQPLKLVF